MGEHGKEGDSGEAAARAPSPFDVPQILLPKGGGAIRGIDAVSRLLAAHFPRDGGGRNELPDAPVVI